MVPVNKLCDKERSINEEEIFFNSCWWDKLPENPFPDKCNVVNFGKWNKQLGIVPVNVFDNMKPENKPGKKTFWQFLAEVKPSNANEVISFKLHKLSGNDPVKQLLTAAKVIILFIVLLFSK